MIFHYELVLLCIAGVLGINNSHLREGESCQLPNDNTGICQTVRECPLGDRSDGARCKSTPSHLRVVCCPTVERNTKHQTTNAETLCQSAPIHTESRIKPHVVGIAKAADVGEFPFMGLLMFSDARMRCGAVLITNRLLLTAAHCFSRRIPTHVRLGTNSATDPGAEPYGIARVVTHPDFKTSKRAKADIAIVELDDEVDPKDENIAPLCLYGSLEDLPANENLTIIGWGHNDTGTYVSPDSLMKGTVRTFPHSECQERYRNAGKPSITSSHLCAQGDPNANGDYTDSCHGDSGGPLVKLIGSKYHLVGIVSRGLSCGLKNYPGVYTRVASYMDWITNEIETKFS